MDATTPSASLDVQDLVRDAPGTWSLDPAGSTVDFHVKHFWGVSTVHGRFDQIDGQGTVDKVGGIVDRTAFGMTWSPLKMASSEARAVVHARFVRS
jgi:polyisoprenoid-binding protein YceI